MGNKVIIRGKVFVLSIVLFLVITACVAVLIWKNSRKDSFEGKGSYDRCVDILNETYPTDIILYGEPLPFGPRLNYRTVSNISDDTFQTEKENQVIILSDLDGSLSISDDELMLIKDRVFSHKCSFYYYGTKLKEKLFRLGFIENEWPEDDYCIGVVPFADRIQYSHDSWKEYDRQITGDNRETLCLILVNDIVYFLKDKYQ